MKHNSLIAGAILMTALATTAWASGNIHDHLTAFRDGTPGVYGRSAMADVGNPDAHYQNDGEEEAMDCSKMPCCKHMDMTGKSGDDCRKMTPEVCEKMLKKEGR